MSSRETLKGNVEANEEWVLLNFEALEVGMEIRFQYRPIKMIFSRNGTISSIDANRTDQHPYSYFSLEDGTDIYKRHEIVWVEVKKSTM